jgi:Spy/CpxP family protein refolding chaperone
MTHSLALCLVIAIGGMGPGGPAGLPVDGPELFRLWQHELQLSDEQLAEIDELHFETRLEMVKKRASVETAELEFAREMDAYQPNEARVMELFETLHKARMELERLHVRNRLRMKSILSDTQQHQLKRLLMEHRSERVGPPPQRRPR